LRAHGGGGLRWFAPRVRVHRRHLPRGAAARAVPVIRDPLPEGVTGFAPASFWERVESRPAIGHAPWDDWGPTSSERVYWYRFDEPPISDTGEWDPLALVALCDTMPGAGESAWGRVSPRGSGPVPISPSTSSGRPRRRGCSATTVSATPETAMRRRRWSSGIRRRPRRLRHADDPLEKLMAIGSKSSESLRTPPSNGLRTGHGRPTRMTSIRSDQTQYLGHGVVTPGGVPRCGEPCQEDEGAGPHPGRPRKRVQRGTSR